MGHAALIDEPLIETEQGSVIAPVWIDGLAPALRALGHELQRKQEFHLTALSRRVFETAANGGDRGRPRAARLAAGRSLAPIFPTQELRIAQDGEGLETVIVLVRCVAMTVLYDDIHRSANVRLEVPPAHVTLYSTDPADGIGASSYAQLDELAPPLDQAPRPSCARRCASIARFAQVAVRLAEGRGRSPTFG